MLPALAEIVSNVVGLQLDSNITAAVLGAVLAPLLRSEPHESPHKRAAGRPRAKRRSASPSGNTNVMPPPRRAIERSLPSRSSQAQR
jgi:hypothetical protein